MLEVDVEDHLRTRVDEVGGLCEKHVSPGRIGVPDDLITWPDGVMQLVETKRPKGPVRSAQVRDHQRRLRYGVRVRLIYTKAQVDEYIEAERVHWDLS